MVNLRRQLPAVLVLLFFAVVAFWLGNGALWWVVAAIAVGWLVGRALLALLRRVARARTGATAPGRRSRTADPPRTTYVVPAALPPPPGLLIGRDSELDAICGQLTGRGRGRPRVIVISGEPGLGKSALAIGAAHLVADHFPDGQLLLRFDAQGGRTVDTALSMVAGAFQAPGDRPPTPAGRQRWYRNRTAGKRVLLILDGVESPDQATRLLPTGRRCAVLITARQPLPSLAPDLAVALAPLAGADRREMLATLVGADRFAAEPEHARRIVDTTAGYPDAIEIVGAALAWRHHWTLQVAIRRLGEVALPDARRRGLPPFAEALDLAYALLTERERTALTLLGLLDTRRVAPWMIAALFAGAAPDGPELTPAAAGRILDRLAHARLVDRQVADGSGALAFRVPIYVQQYARVRLPDRFTTADRERTIRVFAEQRRSREAHPPELSRAVYRRLNAGELSAAMDAGREALSRSRERQAAVRPDTAEAAAALVEEGLTLAAMAEVYAELGWIEEGIACAAAARQAGRDSPRGRPRALRAAGALRRRQRRLAQSEQELWVAEQAAREIDDGFEQIRVLRELAVTLALGATPAAGIPTAEQARDLCEQGGPRGERHLPGVLCAYGTVLRASGELTEAERVLTEAARVDRDTALAQRIWGPWIDHERALVALAAGRPADGRALGLRALAGFTELRHRYGAAHCRLVIGRAHLAEGRLELAVTMFEEAHSTLLSCGDRWLEAQAAVELAAAYGELTRTVPSVDRAQAAVDLLSSAEQAFDRLGDVAARARAGRLRSELEPVQPAGWSRWLTGPSRHRSTGGDHAVLAGRGSDR